MALKKIENCNRAGFSRAEVNKAVQLIKRLLSKGRAGYRQ